MTTISTNAAWQLRPLNQSGIRRLKLAGAAALMLAPGQVIPQTSFVFYEFVFPSDLSCVASFTRKETERGSVFWTQTISFNLPHLADGLVAWIAQNKTTDWVAITEDYNGVCRAFGGQPDGLRLGFQATTGAGPRDANPMAFQLTGDQLEAYHLLPDYADDVLFAPGAGFSYGFSTGFNS